MKMKKKVLSFLLTLCLVMTFVPMAAFAEEPDKISITTVDQLLQFAKAVDMANITIKQMRLYLLMQIWI